MFLITDDFLQIKKTKEKGLGVFARKKIIAGTIIADCLGKVIKTAEYDLGNDKHGLYLMFLTDQASIYPDLSKPGPHLLNHSCKPNCWIYTYCGHTLFFALRDIKSGDELTISYLLSPAKNCKPHPLTPERSDGGRACTHVCKCGSKFCAGTMHLSEDKYRMWQKFQKAEKKKTKTVKFTFGKNLPKLTKYPKIDPNNPIYTLILTN